MRFLQDHAGQQQGGGQDLISCPCDCAASPDSALLSSQICKKMDPKRAEFQPEAAALKICIPAVVRSTCLFMHVLILHIPITIN